jgi:repressor LexA
MERKNPLADVDLDKMPFGLRVRAARNFAGFSQAELAEKLGTTKATISKIETSSIGESLEWAKRIGNALGADVSMLAGFAQAAITPAVGMVPVIGMIAAGNWREAIQAPEERIAVAGAKPHMFALRIFGDSIDRIAPDGSYVTIDPTMPALEDGGLYAVQNGDGEATIKRFRRNPDRLEPESFNEAHKTIELGREPITVIGRATSVTRQL